MFAEWHQPEGFESFPYDAEHGRDRNAMFDEAFAAYRRRDDHSLWFDRDRYFSDKNHGPAGEVCSMSSKSGAGLLTKRHDLLMLMCPFLYVLSSPLSLLARNVQEVPGSQAYRSILLVIILTSLVLVVLWRATRSLAKATMFTTMAALLFFSYGHLYAALKTVMIGEALVGRHRYLVPTYGAILLASVLIIHRRPHWLKGIFAPLTVTGLALVIVPSFGIVSYVVRLQQSSADFGPESGRDQGPVVESPAGLRPDIYYIILDGYARPDVMQRVVGLDVSGFVDFLESSGFYIAQQSNANHNFTALSLASSLNMDFTQNLGLELVRGNYPGVFIEPIRHSRVRLRLEALGYSIMGMRSGYAPTELVDADQFLEPDLGNIAEDGGGVRVNAFESQLLHTTALKVLLDFIPTDRSFDMLLRTQYPFDELREIVRFEFQSLSDAPAIPGPKFVFAHIVSPHSPYLFGPNGGQVAQSDPFTLGSARASDPASDFQLYRDQAVFITGAIQETVATILRESEAPPVIIIQADHGPSEGEGLRPEGDGLRQRLAILNAYHLPYGCDADLYPNISPVNTFRVIFRCYFGQDLELLDDRSYYSYWPREADYYFIPVEELLSED